MWAVHRFAPTTPTCSSNFTPTKEFYVEHHNNATTHNHTLHRLATAMLITESHQDVPTKAGGDMSAFFVFFFFSMLLLSIPPPCPCPPHLSTYTYDPRVHHDAGGLA